jgi:hypothetical protein
VSDHREDDEKPHYSDFIIFADESGDHGLSKIDPSYPVFVLSFCIFRKSDYVRTVIPTFETFKLKWYGHDMTVLHGNEIIRKAGAFRFLNDQRKNTAFCDELGTCLRNVPFSIIAVIVDKQALKSQVPTPRSPYDIALELGLAKVQRFLESEGQLDAITHLIVEERGKNENRDLRRAFEESCKGKGGVPPITNLRLILASKLANSIGLQVADLVSNPIGKHFLQPDQPNRAYECIQDKMDGIIAGNAVGAVHPDET